MRSSSRLTTVPQKQHGMALLMVLFILVLLSTLAVYTAEDENIAIRRAENQRDAEQSRQVAMAGEQWVMSALRRDVLSAPQNVDYLGDEWALLQSDAVQIDDGQMVVQAIDESAKFNLNNLLMGKEIQVATSTPTSTPKFVISPWYGYFTRLLGNLGLDENLADAVVDWVDEGDERTEPDGAEDSTYRSADPPYLSANQPFTSISELAWVAGFGEAEMQAISPYVTALPIAIGSTNRRYTRININTASAMLLRSLSNSNVDSVLLENVLQSRIATPYSQTGRLFTDLGLDLKQSEFTQLVDVQSQYFSVQSCARFGRVDYAQQSLLRRFAAVEEVFVLSRQRRYNCGVNSGPANTVNPTPGER